MTGPDPERGLGTLIVMAKAPVAGEVKTRLCPPCTPAGAARIAAAAITDTLRTAMSTGAEVVLAIAGTPGESITVPAGCRVVPQRGATFAERLVHAFADAVPPGRRAALIGMDTPQVTKAGLVAALNPPAGAEALLGPAVDGGWWILSLPGPEPAAVLRDVPMSTARTGADTRRALRGRGLHVTDLPLLSDVDTAMDALVVASLCPPDSLFRAAVAAELIPAGAGEPRAVAAEPNPAAAELPAAELPAAELSAADFPAADLPAADLPVVGGR